MKNYYLSFFLVMVFLLLGCDVSKIHKKDGCPYCRNAFNTNVQKTELRLQDGSPAVKFDNIGCALRFLAIHPEFNESEIFIQNKDTKIFSNAKELRYNELDLENYPHRYFASPEGEMTLQELENKIRSELMNEQKELKEIL